MFKDEEYLSVVLPDELKVIDRPNCKMLPLDLAPILDQETIEWCGGSVLGKNMQLKEGFCIP